MTWINNKWFYTVPMPDKVDWQRIKHEMDALEIKLQQAEAAMAARKGMTA